MRIVAGEFRSRNLKTPGGLKTRPTPDRLRETLFNILAPEIEGKTFLDLYAGSGAVGLEALSRGAARAIFVDRAKDAIGAIRDNVRTLGVQARADVVCAKAVVAASRYSADIVFLDPPYDLEQDYAAILEHFGAETPRLLIAQHASKFSMPESCGNLQRARVVKQGDNSLTFYRPAG